jgi:hypothetical protein
MKLPISALVLLMIGLPLDAAVKYRFSSNCAGTYARHNEGAIIVNGKHWRIDYDPAPDTVTVLDTIIGGDNGLLAIDHGLHTWYRLTSAKELAIDSSLFSFPYGDTVNDVSKLKIVSHPVQPDAAKPGGSMTSITFSYRIETKVSSERVRGDVWGEIRLWTMEVSDLPDLPWKPLDLQTGLKPVDDGLYVELSRIKGTVWQCEIEVSRRLTGGVVLKQVTRRMMAAPQPAASSPSLFAIPAGFVYQEPVIGAPGAAR